MYKNLLTVIPLIFCLSFSYAQNIDKPKLDAYFKTLEDNNKFMGSVAISQNGQLLYTKAIGYTDIENHTKPNKDTKYRIGSISKTFTTVLIFKAIEEGKLTLGQTINQYFPSVKNSDKITIAQLLSHRSGIHNFTDDEEYQQWNTTKKSEKELTDIIVKGGSDFEPDSKTSYSNSNFVLLSFILQKVYKQHYSEILKEKITKPLNLKNTFYGGKINLKNNESNSYKFVNSWNKEPETDMSVPMGAGAVVSTPTDLTKFAEALFGGQLLSAKSLEQMETIKDGIGMGLFKFPFYDKSSYGHTGGIDGFTSVYSYFPSDKTAVALTSNGSNYDNNKIMIALLSGVYNKPFEIPNFATIEVSSEDLDQYLGVYASQQIPLKLTVTKKDKTLLVQATGQSSFPLEASEKDKFKSEQIGVALEFNPAQKQVILKQHGATFTFNKE
ncbi:peptidase [Pedobacter sp. HMWF019]|uniref:serine hydrolase domain-containing protein n=1 Tax=Pedobacter sp. HMWF019 TaxID=2056856 RepID=UPI000D345BB6|nr:serine hydrolase domain-containing protein [Pedobacter sp. HMWF019]PTS92048.1 peptidase [Pedobacter sp. HMWF019]